MLEVKEMALHVFKKQLIIPKLFKHARSKTIHQGIPTIY